MPSAQSSVLGRPWELNQSFPCLITHIGRDGGEGETTSGISTPGLDGSFLPGLAVMQRHCPSPGIEGPSSQRRSERHWPVAAGDPVLVGHCNTCPCARGVQGVSQVGGLLVSECWEGKYKLNCMLVISFCSKYPPVHWDSSTTGSRGQTRGIPCLSRAAWDSDLPTVLSCYWERQW